MKTFYKAIEEIPAALVAAYDAGRYSFDPRILPCQAHTHWGKVHWINFVRFSAELEKLRETCSSKSDTSI